MKRILLLHRIVENNACLHLQTNLCVLVQILLSINLYFCKVVYVLEVCKKKKFFFVFCSSFTKVLYLSGKETSFMQTQ